MLVLRFETVSCIPLGDKLIKVMFAKENIVQNFSIKKLYMPYIANWKFSIRKFLTFWVFTPKQGPTTFFISLVFFLNFKIQNHLSPPK